MEEEKPKKEKSVKPCGRILLPNHVLRTILETTEIMGDEVCIGTSSKGLDIRMVDSAHIMMLNIVLKPAILPRKSDFVVTKPGIVSFSQADAINFLHSVPKLSTVRFGWKNDAVTFETEDAHCLLKGTELGEYHYTPKMPNFKFDIDFPSTSKKFAAAVRACSKVSDKLTLELDDHRDPLTGETSIFACASDSATEVRFRLGTQIMVEPCSTCRSHYPIEYLVNVSKKLGPWVRVRYAADYPVELTTSITEWGIGACFMLAPRIVGSD